jgi:UDP-N-acetylmuramoylalanine--D-glutamate ligase
MFPARRFEGRRVAVFGLARSGLPCAEALRAGGAEVLAWDDSEAAVTTARAAGRPWPTCARPISRISMRWC